MRINKYLAESGHCSRRQADELIKQNKVFINDEIAELGSQVDETDEVKVGKKLIINHQSSIYIAYHKPVGVICTTDETKRDNIIEKIDIKERIYPVGRLDVESSGLIILTNDGDFANKIMHPKFKHEKEYLVETEQVINEQSIKKLRQGIKLREGIAKADKILRVSDNKLRIVVHQGWNRQIRRMVENIGYEVLSLKRIRVGSIKMEDLPPGKWRNLTEKEKASAFAEAFRG